MRENNVINQGFTLVEIAMVTVIFSLMMNLFGHGLLAYQKKQKYETTHQRIGAIEKALDEFLEINGRLPCVASINLRSGQAGFGVEVDSNANPNINVCSIVAGTTRYAQAGVGGVAPVNNNNMVGSVPVRSLNLPDEYIGDAWGSRFTYIVSERQSSESAPDVSTYKQNSGAINVVDKNGNSVIDQVNQQYPPNNNFAEYVLISHGEDKRGGPSLSSGAVPLLPCPTIASGEDQAENCIHTAGNPNIVVSDVIDDDNYDDIVRYKAGTNRNEILPSGAVIGFDQVYAETGTIAANNGTGAVSTAEFQCPVGWRAFDDARGRFIMGATGVGVPITRVERSNSITVSGGVRDYENLGQTEVSVGTDKDLENAKVTVPPFVTTLFCEKQ